MSARKSRIQHSIHHYSPLDLALEMLRRVTRDKGLSFPECSKLILKICARYSQAPQRTYEAIVSSFKCSYLAPDYFYIVRGGIAQRELLISIYVNNCYFQKGRKAILDLVKSGEIKSRAGKAMCDLCEIWKNARYVYWRSNVYEWLTDDCRQNRKNTLCTACWNKVKPIAKAKREADEIKYLYNKLNREALKWHKSKTPANCAASCVNP